MRKFILNLLTVLAWIYQAICVLGIIAFVIVIGFIPFGLKNPDFRAGFESGMGVKGLSVNNYVGTFIVMIGLEIIMGIASFLICRYARLIIRNIKREVYFASDNLSLLKKLLISVAGYTVISIVNFIILMTHRAWFVKYASNTLYPSGITSGLLFLAVLYIVYLVFKYGMKVQEDADSII
ncbi:DUF2975 domain-containing protein [uncultured Lactobacillus sp.]|uniref:DUF2975 domain-containing protein n=1 Tax=uncultured Lactobacillus sp. TaxID=153152 RepID=UPI002804806F|nr:DUF2975 domain-containing protein [uncultured Lactobacillus sp.]